MRHPDSTMPQHCCRDVLVLRGPYRASLAGKFDRIIFVTYLNTEGVTVTLDIKTHTFERESEAVFLVLFGAVDYVDEMICKCAKFGVVKQHVRLRVFVA